MHKREGQGRRQGRGRGHPLKGRVGRFLGRGRGKHNEFDGKVYNSEKERQKLLSMYNLDDLEFVLDQIDLEFEKSIGYDYQYVYNMIDSLRSNGASNDDTDDDSNDESGDETYI